MKRAEIDFTEGVVGLKIVKFVIPVILAYMVQQLYSSVDLIFVSNIIGNEGAAATSASGSFIALSIGFFWGLTAGAGILYARAFGGGDTPFYFIYIMMEVLSNSIRAKGRTGVAVAIYLVFIAGLRIVSMIIFSATGTLNIYTVCVVYPVSWACAMLCSYICWRRIRVKD